MIAYAVEAELSCFIVKWLSQHKQIQSGHTIYCSVGLSHVDCDFCIHTNIAVITTCGVLFGSLAEQPGFQRCNLAVTDNQKRDAVELL